MIFGKLGWRKKLFLRALESLLAFTLIGFFILPPIVKSLVLDQLATTLHRPVSIGGVSINPFELTLKIDNLRIGEREGDATFFAFDSLFLNLDSASLFKQAAVLREIRLENPKFRVVRIDEKTWNFSDLLAEFSRPPKLEADSSPVFFSLNNILISGGDIAFVDQPVHKQHRLDNIRLALPFVSNMAYALETFVEPAFSANFNGAPIQLEGKSKPFSDSLESELALNLNAVSLPSYIAYLPADLPYRLESGVLDTALKLGFRQEKERGASLSLTGKVSLHDVALQEKNRLKLAFSQFDLTLSSTDMKFGQGKDKTPSLLVAGAASLRDVAFQEKDRMRLAFGQLDLTLSSADLKFGQGKDRPSSLLLTGTASLRNTKLADKAGESLLAFKQLDLALAPSDLFAQRFDVESLKLTAPEINTRIDKQGNLNWMSLVPEDDPAKKPTPAPEWGLRTLQITKGRLNFLDESRPEPAQLDLSDLETTLRKLESTGKKPADIETRFRLGKQGEVALSGHFTQKPQMNAHLNLDLKALELLPFQSWFSDFVNVIVTRGHLTLNGALDLQQAENKAAEKTPELKAAFTGQATLGDFRSIDKHNAADFLRWKSFYLGKMAVRTSPLAVDIGEVALADFFARVIVSPEGKLNLTQIVRQEETPAAPEKPASGAEKTATPPESEDAPLPPVRIGKITLQGGSVRFTDNFVKPNYTANLRKVGGRIEGLSSAPGTTAKLELRGSYDDVAPLTIDARINPLSKKPYLDLEADVKGVEMTAFSPYSGKYAGYAIDKGKLSLFVKYKIENDQLQAENRLFLDQLTFGEKVESPDATSLPVNLALALLKNRRGEIDIDFPIAGSLTDPQFSIGGLVFKVIGNLLVKAVTSPFALIGSLFGSGEELSNVEFDFGRADITPAMEKRLGNLVTALLDRPALQLEITARADAGNDPEGLRRLRLDRKVRAVKRDEQARQGTGRELAETPEISDKEYPALLERVYKAEKFPKPRNAIGLVKSLPVEEMEKLILTHSPVDENDLRELADERARNVRDWLVRHEVPLERVFLLPGKLEEQTEKSSADNKHKLSRVDFSLK